MKPLHGPLEASSDLSSGDVPLKIFEEINEKYLRIGDELFLILDEIENNDHIDEETKLTAQEVENIVSTEPCIKKCEDSSFRIIMENVTKDNCKIFLNVDDPNFTLKCRVDTDGENYSSFQDFDSKTPSEDIKKTPDDSSFEETSAEVPNNSNEDDKISKVCSMSVGENIFGKPELQAATNSVCLRGSEIRGASTVDIFKSNLNRVNILNVEHNDVQINQGGSLQDEISVANLYDESHGTRIFTYDCISYQEELVQMLVEHHKDHSKMESVPLVYEKELTSNEIFIGKNKILSLLKKSRKIKRSTNNNLKLVAKNMSALKLKERNVKKKGGKTVNIRNTSNELGKSLDKATFKSSETSMELIKKYKLKEINVVLKKLDFNFEQLQNKCLTTKKYPRNDVEGCKPAYLNDTNKDGSSTKINNGKKSVKNKFPDFKQNEGAVMKNKKTNERNAQLNSSNAHEICNVSVKTKTVGESVTQEVYAKCKTDLLSVAVSKMRSFSELQREMIKNNVKTVNIPENIYAFFKQNSSLTPENSNLRIICNKDLTNPVTSLMNRKTPSVKNDERSEMLASEISIDNVPSESSEKSHFTTVNNEEFKNGLNSTYNDSSGKYLPLAITGEKVIANTSNDKIVSSLEQCYFKSKNNKRIKNGFSSAMSLNIPCSTFANNNKKFKSDCSYTLTKSSLKHSNFYTENKKSKSKFSNLSLQNSQTNVTLNTKRSKINQPRSVLKMSKTQINSYIEYFKKIKHLSTTVASETSPKQVALPAKNGKKFKVGLSNSPAVSSLKHQPQHNAIKFKFVSTNHILTETLTKKLSSTKNFKINKIKDFPAENSEKQIISQENQKKLKHYLSDLMAEAPVKKLSFHTKDYKNLASNSSNVPIESYQKHLPLLLENIKKSKENLSDAQKKASQISLSLYKKKDKKNKKCEKKLRRLIVSSSLWGVPSLRKRNHKIQDGGPPKRSLIDFPEGKGNCETKDKKSLTAKKNATKGTILSHQMPCRLNTDENCDTSGIKASVDMNHNVSSGLIHKGMNIHHIGESSKCQDIKSSEVDKNSVYKGCNGNHHPDILPKNTLIGPVKSFIGSNKKYTRGHPEVSGLTEVIKMKNENWF